MFQRTVSGSIKWATGHKCLKFVEGFRMETSKNDGYCKDQMELSMAFQKQDTSYNGNTVSRSERLGCKKKKTSPESKHRGNIPQYNKSHI